MNKLRIVVSNVPTRTDNQPVTENSGSDGI
jgi:hypothetical protein